MAKQEPALQLFLTIQAMQRGEVVLSGSESVLFVVPIVFGVRH